MTFKQRPDNKSRLLLIEERREEINNRQELGHWEMDTVVGKRGGKSSCILY